MGPTCEAMYGASTWPRRGQLNVIMWLSERGARATTKAADRASAAGQQSVVEYLLRTRN